MTYTSADLALFKPLSQAQERVGTAYFEFHPKDLTEPNACWLPGSLLLQDAAFDFFAECFHRADPDFDYFSFQSYDTEGIWRICSELQGFVDSLSALPSRSVLFSRYSSLFKEQIWAEVATEKLAPSVRICGAELLELIRAQTLQSQRLWVLGM